MLGLVWKEGEIGNVPNVNAFGGAFDLGDPGEIVEDRCAKDGRAVRAVESAPR